MAESVLQPSEIFKSIKVSDLPQLVRKPADKFIVIPAAKYVDVVSKALDKISISPAYKRYLKALLEVSGKKSKTKDVEDTFAIGKKDINTAEVTKYFGGILGPIHLMATGDWDEVVFPVRSNYELFDYFMGKKGQYTGFSAKAMGGTSNTLAPGIINERVEMLSKKGKIPQQSKPSAAILIKLATMPIYSGLISAAGVLVKSNMLPQMSPAASKALKKINFDRDAVTFDTNKATTIAKSSGISDKAAYVAFMDEYVMPRVKGNRPASGNYTMTQIAYGMAMLLVDASKSRAVDLTPLIKLTFQDLNIVKMGLTGGGVPQFAVKNVTKTSETYELRSKYYFTQGILKDKLGVQL